MTTTIHKFEINLEVTYHFDKGEKEGRHNPGSPPQIEIESVRVNGADVFKIISVDALEQIEKELLEDAMNVGREFETEKD
jgi:hypothetical protein